MEKELVIPFKWADRYPVLLEKFLYIPGHYEKHERLLSWADPEIFGNENPVAVEYCSGNGQWIGERAKENPHLNWVAVEKLFERARKAWNKKMREEIPNLFIVCGEASTFTKHYLYEASVAEVYVNFPDPWPKLRHTKHRLVRAPFIQELGRVLPWGGKVTCVTDDATYASQMVEEFEQCTDWKQILQTTEWSGYGRSFFNELWTSKGLKINYLQFEKAK